MILQPLIDLCERDGDMSPYGYESHKYHFAIVLDGDGNVVGLDDLTIDKEPIKIDVPYWPPNRTSGIIPSFLTDPATYLLALNGPKRWDAWQAYNLEMLAGASDPRLIAVRTWIENWTPEAAGFALPRNS